MSNHIPALSGPQQFLGFTLGGLDANILEVDHKRLFLDVPAKGAEFDITIETRDALHTQDIIDALTEAGIPVLSTVHTRFSLPRSGRRRTRCSFWTPPD